MKILDFKQLVKHTRKVSQFILLDSDTINLKLFLFDV